MWKVVSVINFFSVAGDEDWLQDLRGKTLFRSPMFYLCTGHHWQCIHYVDLLFQMILMMNLLLMMMMRIIHHILIEISH